MPRFAEVAWETCSLFETTGVGSCLVTDEGSNMSDLFVPDEEVITYESYDELMEKLAYLKETQALESYCQGRSEKDP